MISLKERYVRNKMKAWLYIIGEFSICLIILNSIGKLLNILLKLILELNFTSILLGILVLFIVISIIFRIVMYIEQKH